MKSVMRELAQAKRHYSRLPLFEFLRTESIAPRDRLAFYPCMAPFILAFSDLNRFVLRDGGLERSMPTAHQRAHPRGRPSLALVPRGLHQARLRSHCECHAHAANVHEGRSTAESHAGLAPRAAAVRHDTEGKAGGRGGHRRDRQRVVRPHRENRCAHPGRGRPRASLSRSPFRRETGHAMHGADHRVLEAIALTEVERVHCLDLAFRVFDMFTDWTSELLAYARNSLAHRTVPQIMARVEGARA